MTRLDILERLRGIMETSIFDKLIYTKFKKLKTEVEEDVSKYHGSGFMNYHTHFFNSILDITMAKNHDYAGEKNDPFHNFKTVETMGITSAEKGILVRMVDKMNRIGNFLDQGVLKVEDEKIEDTLKDLANYAGLMANLIHHRRLEIETKGEEEWPKKESIF